MTMTTATVTGAKVTNRARHVLLLCLAAGLGVCGFSLRGGQAQPGAAPFASPSPDPSDAGAPPDALSGRPEAGVEAEAGVPADPAAIPFPAEPEPGSTDAGAGLPPEPEPEPAPEMPEPVIGPETIVAPAAIDPPPRMPEPDVARARRPWALRDRHYLGFGLDMGVSGVLPDISVLAAYEPVPWLRGAAGFGYNLIGFGIKGGLTLVNPFFFPVSLTLEGGRYFKADANPVFRALSDQEEDIASLERVGYDYANLLLGLEVGSRTVRFYARGGLTFLRARADRFAETLQMAGTSVSRSSDPRISYRGPSLKLGLFFFLP